MNAKQVLDEREVSSEYSLSVPWLRKRRRLGGGPPFLKIGEMVRYWRKNVETYLEAHMVQPHGAARDTIKDSALHPAN